VDETNAIVSEQGSCRLPALGDRKSERRRAGRATHLRGGIAMIFGLSVDKGRISLIEWDDLDLFGHVATERTD